MTAKIDPPIPVPADTRQRYHSATLAKGCQVRLKKQYIDGTLTPDRPEQVIDGRLELFDAIRFLELAVTYRDGSKQVVWVPWAQVGQVEPG